MGEEIKPEVLGTPDVAQQEQQPLEEKTVLEEVAGKVGDAVEDVKDVVGDVVEDVKDAVGTVKEAVVNYGEKTLAELSSLFQELTEKADRMSRSKEAEAIKSAFYKKLSKEKADAGLDGNVEDPDEAVSDVPSVEEGAPSETSPSEEAPAPEVDAPEEAAPEVSAIETPFSAIEEGFKALYAKYKKERAEYNRRLDAEREDNLAKKLSVIEDLKALTESQGDMKDLFPQFREIQDRWRAIGPVPAQNFRDVNDTYQHCVEQFYDLVQINRELRDLDFKKNLEVKEQFCSQAEELCNSEDVVGAFKELQKLHEQWKEYGPVAKEFRESIWERFRAATGVINRKYQQHFEGLKGQQAENLASKTALCEKVEQIADGEITTSAQWNALSREIEEIQAEWRKIGFASRKENQKIYDRFRAACDRFFERKRAYYVDFKGSMAANMEKKLAIISEAESLKDSTEWKKTTDRLIALQKEWKEIGAVPRKKSEQLWKQFRSACDAFFAERDKNQKPGENDYYANLKAKKALIEEINASEATDNESAAAFAERWREIGFVPFKEKEAVQEAFRKAMQEKFPEFGLRGGRPQGQRSGRTPAAKGPKSEKDRLVEQYNRLQQDIATYENNIGFFSSSAKAESMIKLMQERIDSAKAELKMLEGKIREIEASEESSE